MRLLIAMLCWTLIFCGSPGWAEPAGRFGSESIGVERPWLVRPLDVRLAQAGEEAGVGDVDARIAELTAERDRIRNGWPRAGMITGIVMTVLGTFALVAINVNCHDDADWFDDGPDHTNCAGGSVDGAWAAGGIAVGGGLILLGTSVATLVKHNKKRRAIQRQILDLQRGHASRTAPSWGLGFEAGERKNIHLGWRF